MSIAVVIPFFKKEFFRDTLQSLARQTDANFNIYVGDDASPEDPLEILREYQDRLNLVYHRFEVNCGSHSLTKHWERCISMTNDEEWVMLLGDDDILSPGVIASFYDHMSSFSGKVNIVRFATQIINELNEPVSEVFVHPEWESPEEAFLRRYFGKTRSSLSEYIFLREKFNKYKFADYPLAWHSDDRAWLEFSEEKLIYTINESLIFFRHSAYNITGREDNLQQKESASLDFYKFLGNFAKFSKEHRLMFGRIYERKLREEGPLKRSERFNLFKLYSRNANGTEFIRFLKRLLNDSLKRPISRF